MGEAVDDRNKRATVTRQSVFELAHEIRNPLASIQGVADAFLQRGQLTTQEREWMEAVRREVSKIDARVRELLELCARVCDACAAECEKHDHEHCRLCAQICRECAEDCRNAAASVTPVMA